MNNHTTCAVRVSHLIKKSEIVDFLNKDIYQKVEWTRGKNVGLKNPDVCKIRTYHAVPLEVFNSMFGNIKKWVSENAENPAFVYEDKTFLTSIQSCTKTGWISKSHLVKIINLQAKYSAPFGIAKSLRKLSLL
jgi:hypothetical protein